jgi:hypothetical protein
MTPRPPITVRPAGAGRVLVAGAPRTALVTVADGTVLRWDPARSGWLLPAEHVPALLDWARRAGRSVEITEEVRRDG